MDLLGGQHRFQEAGENPAVITMIIIIIIKKNSI